MLKQQGWDSDLHELDEMELEDDRRRKELFVLNQQRLAAAEGRSQLANGLPAVVAVSEKAA